MKQWTLAFAVAVTLLVASFTLAFAHETRTVGKYDFEVGWLNEPAYVNMPNAMSISVTDHATQKPVDGLVSALQAEVIFGGESMQLKLRPVDEQAGLILGDLIPTKTGSYIFHITGNIAGQAIDERFESGPGRFDDVTDATALQFPTKLGSSQDLTANLQAAQTTAASAQLYGIVGLTLGAAGIMLGGWSLFRHK